MRLIAICCLLAGCVVREPPSVVRLPVEVKVPVPVPCLSSGDVPKLPLLLGDKELAALTNRDLIISIEIQRRELRAWQQQVAPILAACVKD